MRIAVELLWQIASGYPRQLYLAEIVKRKSFHYLTIACKKCTSQKSVVAESKDSSSEQEIEQELEEELVVESEEEFEEESQKELENKEQWQAATLANLKARKQEHDNKKHASTAASASTSNKQSKVVNLESARTKMKLPLQHNQALPSIS